MTTRNLDALFEPRAIALIGASNTEGSVGCVLARNLLESGFTGPVMPVNPHLQAVRSAIAYATVADLPITPDLAVIATPPETVPGLIDELGRRGCRAAVVITSGIAGALRDQMLQAAKPHLLRIVGPNCLGFISPARGVNASFAHLTPAAGGVALVAQSGAVAAAAIDWAQVRGVGFSHVITIGDAADVDFGDLLDHLSLDPNTRAILLYVESITDARKFMSAGRIAARAKPVVVIKAGRSAAGAKAAFSHTGALAGSDAVYDAAFRRCGMLRVGTLREAFDAIATLNTAPRVKGDRLAILTNGGGAGVLATDELEARGGRLATLSPPTLAALQTTAPAGWTYGDPVDIRGDAPPDRYGAGLEALLAEPEADAVLVMNCPVAVADSTAAADAVIETVRRLKPSRPVLACWLGAYAVAEGRRRLTAAGLPVYETPEEAVGAFAQLVEHRRNQDLLLQTPALLDGGVHDVEAARAVVKAALAAGRTHLSDPEARALLAAYGIPTIMSRAAASPAEAAAIAVEMGGAVALKIRSPQISHKSDMGGVALGLEGAVMVQAAAEAMLQRVGRLAPDAVIEGFEVEPMAARPMAVELIAGIVRDAAFGPAILVGEGGTAVEVIADRSLGLPPLDDVLARDMIGRTRVAKRLAGYRDRPAAKLDAVAQVLIALGRIAVDLPEVAELDINPLLTDADGVLALDARVRLSPPSENASPPAIRPYPADLVRSMVVGDQTLILRPIRADDMSRIKDLVALSTREDVRFRFHSGFKILPDSLARRLSQIDYDREMALVAEAADQSIAGVARLVADPEGECAEFALMVRSDHQNQGVGRMLLAEILSYGQRRGLREIWGDVARDNSRMREMASAFGFVDQNNQDLSRLRVSKRFAAGEAVAKIT